MLNQNTRPYLNQVAMIESQYESKRKNTPSISSLLQNKSPLRDRQNTNSINTPSRIQIGNKVSLSPIRSRRGEASTSGSSIRSTSTAVSRRKNTSENYCENHSTKTAKFMIDKDNEYFYFCEKCAIPLISNGFKLTKLEDDNPRLKEIGQFLKQLEAMDNGMHKRKQSILDVISQGERQFNSEVQKIQEYYAQFYYIIDEHKKRVLEEIKSEFAKSTRPTFSTQEQIDQAIASSTNMKEDIMSSMNSVILEVADHEFRSVMNQYYGYLNKFKGLCNDRDEPIKVRTLAFRDGEALCQTLVEGLVIEWDDEEQDQEKEEHKEYQTHQKVPPEPQSDRQNPIQCLETEQRQKNMKELGGLFCSFDQ